MSDVKQFSIGGETIMIKDEYARQNKADKAVGAVAGNLANLDSDGNPVDSGIPSTKIAEIESKVLTLGNSAGIAEGIADSLSAGTAQEITFRKSGGDGVNYMKAIKGKTLAWNQLMVPIASTTSADIFINSATAHLNGGVIDFTVNAAGGNINTYPRQVTLISGHKYYQASIVKGTTAGVNIIVCGIFTTTRISWTRYSSIVDGTGQSFFFSWTDRRSSDWDAIYVKNKPILIDLTLMYGAGNEPSTVEEFEAMFPEAYYPYNAGTPISNDAEALETVGFNLFPSEPVNGVRETFPSFDETKYAKLIAGKTYFFRHDILAASSYRHWYKVFDVNGAEIKVPGIFQSISIPVYYNNSTYSFIDSVNNNSTQITFTVSSDCYIYFGFGSGSVTSNDEMRGFCINLSDASKNGTYEPYWKRIINLNLSTLKDKDGNLVFPYGGMNGVGTAFDILKPDAYGVIRDGTRAFGRVDLGAQKWFGSNGVFYANTDGMGKKAGSNNLLCDKYTTITPTSSSGINGICQRPGSGNEAYINIIDSAYSDSASLRASLSGVMLYYELATPVEFELAEPIPNAILVDELGTEQAIFPTHEDSSPSAPLCTDSNYSISVKNLVAKLNSLNNS